MKTRSIVIIAIVLLLSTGALSGRIEHYSVRHDDILSEKRYTRLCIFGITVYRAVISEQVGFIEEYKNLFGSEPNPKHLRVDPADFSKGLFFRTYRSYGVGFESRQRREIIRQIYNLHGSGRPKNETKHSLSILNGLISPDSPTKELDFEALNTLRKSIGLSAAAVFKIPGDSGCANRSIHKPDPHGDIP